MQISDMILRVNIIGRKVSIACVNRTRGSEGVLRPSGSCGGWSVPRNVSGSKVYLDFLKIDLNVATIITVQYLKHRKANVNGSRHIQC